MTLVAAAVSFRNEKFNALPDQRIPGITEHRFRLRVHVKNLPFAIDGDHRVRNRFQYLRRKEATSARFGQMFAGIRGLGHGLA